LEKKYNTVERFLDSRQIYAHSQAGHNLDYTGRSQYELQYKGRVTSWMPQAVNNLGYTGRSHAVWITQAGHNLGYTGRSQFGFHCQVTILEYTGR
jgi:hypothetical protein